MNIKEIKYIKMLFIAIGLIYVNGCSSRIPFTYYMKEEYKLTPSELQSLQFYNAKKITLQRELLADDRNIAKGKLITKSGKYIDEIIIKANTPGIAVLSGENWISISFEEGTSLNYLSDEKYRENWKGKYALGGEKWENNIGTILFAGKEYLAIHKSGDTFLLIDKKSLEKIEKTKKILKGRTLDN
jgi:hypothetical protein